MDWLKLLEDIDKEDNVYKKLWMRFLAISYYRYLKLKSWLWEKNFNKTHVSISYSNGKLQLSSLKHEDFIKITQKKINQYAKEKSLTEFLSLSLQEALGGCNYIIFEQVKNKSMFIQFWTGNKKLEFDFIGNKKNGLKKYYYGVLGVLADNELVIKGERKNFTYTKYKNKKDWGIQANMGKDAELAAKCIEIILVKVYHLKPESICAVVS